MGLEDLQKELDRLVIFEFGAKSDFSEKEELKEKTSTSLFASTTDSKTFKSPKQHKKYSTIHSV